MNGSRTSSWSSLPPVVKNLIAINVIMWLATIATPRIFNHLGITFDLTNILGMHYWASEKFNLAQLITYMFMHGGLAHLFFNMFALYMFGSVLEVFWEPRRFLFYYLVTGVGAGIVQQLFWTVEYHAVITAMNDAIAANSGEYLIGSQGVLEKYFKMSSLQHFTAPDVLELKRMFLNLPITVGASGSVFGLLLAFGYIFPDVQLRMLFIPIPIKASIFVVIYGVAELFLGVANFSGDSVAHFAHLGGMLFGIILLLVWKERRHRT